LQTERTPDTFAPSIAWQCRKLQSEIDNNMSLLQNKGCLSSSSRRRPGTRKRHWILAFAGMMDKEPAED
jgi:hypothetical protein